MDIAASIGASAWACKASSRHFFGFENDQDIFDSLFKQLCDSMDKDLIENDGDEDL